MIAFITGASGYIDSHTLVQLLAPDRELIAACGRTCGRAPPVASAAQHPSDLANSDAPTAMARELLGWPAQFGVDAKRATGWRSQPENIEDSEEQGEKR